jgi:D-sedoheptulose 7-phosphate isomerase|tara:strand:- start:2075 stop:2569 length:495 start_codon:yes stop_codon:yes gene_type:complete
MDLELLKLEIDKIKLIKDKLSSLVSKFNKIIIIGNGGSNAIASHIAVDYTKFLNKQALSFSDSPRLTAYINDYGRDEAYKQFIKEFADKDTLIILISSSGNSMNVVNTAKYCEDKFITYVALSGFNKINKLNNMNANFKYWVDAKSYGVVECAHEILLHSIVKN